MAKLTEQKLRQMIREELLVENKFEKVILRLNKLRGNKYRITANDNQTRFWVINQQNNAPITPQLPLEKLYTWLENLANQLEVLKNN